LDRKLVLIGIDGATWKTLGPLISSGELQNFRTLISQGTISVLRSTIPAESPPAWTSMFTGVNPGKHGIVDFLLREEGKFVPCMSRYRMSETIWQLLSQAGRKCIIINDPVTFPPEPVNGIMTTGLMTPPGSTNWIFPKSRMDEVDTIARGYECDIPPDFGTIFSKDREAALNVVNRLASKVFRVGTYAAFNLEWDVLAVIFTVTDRLQHFAWNEGYRISELYKRLDNMLGEFIQSAEEASADLIVVSDHGFGPCHKFVSLNGFLEEAGLTVRTESTLSKMLAELGFTRGKMRKIMGAWPSTFTALPTFFQDMIRRAVPESKENIRELDTSKSAAFAKTPGGIFLRDDHMRDIVVKKLMELTDQTTGMPMIEKIMNRDEVLQGPYSYRAPDLFLEPSPGYGFSLDKADVERGFTGVHRPEGIFIHYRPNGDAQRLRDNLVRPWDVAATVLNILGVSVPSHFDGTPIIAQD